MFIILLINKIGKSPIITIRRAALDALSSISSFAYWYTYVAKVSKLKGLNNNVIGSSLIISTKARINAVNIDGLNNGNITFLKLYQNGLPSDLLASSKLGGNLFIPLLIAPNETALNLETYAKINKK